MTDPTDSSNASTGKNWICKLEVANGGYLNGLNLRFVPDGNVACGDPGTGKTTMLAYLAFALDIPVPEAKRKEFDELITHNLGAGRVIATLAAASGLTFVVSRGVGDD